MSSGRRSSLVDIDLDKGQEIVDRVTNQPISYEILSTGESYRHIRFLAQDVPSVGYRAYSLKRIPDAPLHRRRPLPNRFQQTHWKISSIESCWTLGAEL